MASTSSIQEHLIYEVYETAEGKIVVIGAIEAKVYDGLLERQGLEEADLPDQMDRANWPTMKERFVSLFSTKFRDEWTEIFEGVDACVTPVLSPRGATGHSYNTARNVFSIESVTQRSPAPRFSKTPRAIVDTPKTAGSGMTDGLAIWGIDAERVQVLRAAGAFSETIG